MFTNKLRLFITYLLTNVLMWKTGGKASLMTDLYCLFKSLAAKEHLVLPMMTPSGFSIGTILKIYLSLSSAATSDSPVKKWRMPLMIHELGVSPGWTRALNTITCFRFKSSWSRSSFMYVINPILRNILYTNAGRFWWSKLDIVPC